MLEAKVELSISHISGAARQLLTAGEIAALPQAPEIPDEGRVSDDPVIAWSAFLLWAYLRDEL